MRISDWSSYVCSSDRKFKGLCAKAKCFGRLGRGQRIGGALKYDRRGQALVEMIQRRQFAAALRRFFSHQRRYLVGGGLRSGIEPGVIQIMPFGPPYKRLSPGFPGPLKAWIERLAAAIWHYRKPPRHATLRRTLPTSPSLTPHPPTPDFAV